MVGRASWAVAAAVAVAAALAAAAALNRLSPPPTAQPSLGSEEAFGRGLHPREVTPSGMQRWTTERAEFRFRRLPPGPASLEVRIRGHRTPVAVAANGVVVGIIEPGRFVGRYSLDIPGRHDVVIELRTEGFAGGHGRLGALVERVRITPSAAAALPPLSLVLAVLAPTLVLGTAAAASGWGPMAAAGFAMLAAVLQGIGLAPFGLARSDYTSTLALELVVGGLAAAVFARWRGARQPGSGRWAYCAVLVAWLVQAVAATSPLMVVSDAVFHANKLASVAGGDLLLTSLTQHDPPVRFPYGIAFYVPLWPFYAAGWDPVRLVRWGAALSAVGASAGLFVLLARAGPASAALAGAIFQLLPGVFDLFSFGNLSNVFAQSMATLFFAWSAVEGKAGRWPVGAALVVAAGLGHLSTFVVLLALCPALLLIKRDAARRRLLLAAAVGLGLCGLYYLQFAGLARAEMSRLAGSGGASGEPLWVAVGREAAGLVRQWGWPVLPLLALGWPRPARGGLDRQLLALWAAGLALFAVAVLTPLDVRYAYAVAPAAAAAAAWGCVLLDRRGLGGRILAVALIAVQAVIAGRNLAGALFERYRG